LFSPDCHLTPATLCSTSKNVALELDQTSKKPLSQEDSQTAEAVGDAQMGPKSLREELIGPAEVGRGTSIQDLNPGR
jgi:hypothetical protein